VNPPLSPMSSLSDGQRYALKHRLGEFAGSSVRLILVGNNPQPGILFEQLADIFKDAGWNVQTMQAGMVSAVGENFPHFPYLTGPNISAPAVRNVFSIFAAVGIDLPLTPDWWDEAGMLSLCRLLGLTALSKVPTRKFGKLALGMWSPRASEPHLSRWQRRRRCCTRTSSQDFTRLSVGTAHSPGGSR